MSSCPVSARHFGDFNDPDSDVSRLTAERGGFDLMPESGYRPVNKYLPPRPRRDGRQEAAPAREDLTPTAETPAGKFLQWADKLLSL